MNGNTKLNQCSAQAPSISEVQCGAVGAIVPTMVVNNSEFLSLLLKGATGYGWVCAFAGNPGSKEDARWWGKPYSPGGLQEAEVDAFGDRNSYFSVAELKPLNGNQRARQKQYFQRLRALVIDDSVDGTLVSEPTYILETSPGKVQAGVFLDPDDPDTADAQLIDALMGELYERKLMGDVSGNNLVRYVRLPVGQNQKPRESGHHQHRMLVWNPGIVYSLADACGVFGVDLDEVRAKKKPEAAEGVELFGDVPQAQLLAEAIRQIVTGETYHDPLNRIAASMSACGLQPGASVNLLRGLMSVAKRKETWDERYADIPRAVDTATKFKGKSWAPPGEPDEKEPLLVPLGQVMKDRRPIQWLVKGWIEERALSCLFGPSGVGKSFIAYDIAACIATGTPWHGCRVKQGPVVMVIGEGKEGVKRRMTAWAKERGIDLSQAPIHITTRPVQMLDRAAAIELADAIAASVPKTDGPPVLVIIDTLARNFGAGDENSAKDASAFVQTVDEMLKQRFGCHVMVVHHSGHEAGRARGSSAFKAAWDQEFSAMPVSAADIVKLAATKMKDAEIPNPMEFKLEEVIYDEDEDGNKVSSLVPMKMGSEWDQVLATPKSGIVVTVGWMLERLIGQYFLTRSQLIEQGLTRAAATNAIQSLQLLGYAEKDGNYSTARLKVTEKGKLLLSRAGRAFGKDFEAHNGRAEDDDEDDGAPNCDLPSVTDNVAVRPVHLERPAVRVR